MAITKMLAVTIAGKIHEFEQVIDRYVYGRDIHLENAMYVLGGKKKLRSFTDGVHYEAVVKSAEDIIELAGIDISAHSEESDMSLDEMKSFLDDINSRIENEKKCADSLRSEIEENRRIKESLANMQDLKTDLSKLAPPTSLSESIYRNKERVQ